MSFIQVQSKRLKIDEELIELDIIPRNKEYTWTETSIRSEEVREYYKLSSTQTVLIFYEQLKSMIILEEYEKFHERIKDIDYVDE